jgi:acyl transferase domain-containing protein/NAD(P)-dependent dehydrogenase (short-subunit alcohol dehydrogenase family)
LNSTDTPPPMTPLAIVGIGCLFPGAPGFGPYWSQILRGADAISDVPATHWRPEDYYHPDPKAPDRVYACRGGFLEPVAFNPAEFGIAPNNLEATDTAQLLGLVVARAALVDAGYAPEPAAEGQGLRRLDRSRTSVILGVTGTLELVIPLGARLGHPVWRRALAEAGVAEDVAEDVVRRIGDAYVGWQENSFPGLLGNVVAGRIANRFDLGGTNCVVDAACASSLSALHLAALELHSGRADVVLTGGVDTFNDVFMFMCFSKTPALSPTGDARPFDAAADGTVLGEGVGMVVLKRLDEARRDGDRIYAVLRGVGSASDGRGNAVYAPRAAGQVEALEAAYRVADVSPATVELVEAHGTGTKVGDATEAEALAEVYRASGRSGAWCALGSVKSQIGHTKAAAGVAGLIKAAAALYHKVLPPTLKVREPIEPLRRGDGPLYVNTEARPWPAAPDYPRRAAVSAFGFGGSNFHCVLEEAEAQKARIHWDGAVQILALGADTPEALRALLAQERAACPRGGDWLAFRARALRSRGAWNPLSAHRLILVAQREKTDLPHLFDSALGLLNNHPNSTSARTPEGIFCGRGGASGKLAALFPGQGSQYVGMFRELACRFPAVQEALSAADMAVGRTQVEPRLSARIYPPPAFTPEQKALQEATLRDTRAAQPALGAVGLGAWRLLQHFGVHADAAAGHSYGELTALCAVGRIDEGELYTLSILRGSLMACSAGSEAGAMLAVRARAESVARLLGEEGLDLVVANKNSPEQTVLSGPAAVIARAEEALSRCGLLAQRLAVANAFHSPLVAAAAEPFRRALEPLSLPPGRVPVFANTTGAAYPEDPTAARDLLAGQLARPVEWIAEVEQLYAAGMRTFVEIGPGRRLSGLVRAILGDRDHASVALDASEGKRDGVFDLACCLAELASHGHAVRLDAWDPEALHCEARPDNGRPTLTVPLCGANYVKPRLPRPVSTNEHPPIPKAMSTPKMNGSSPHSDTPVPAGRVRPTPMPPAPAAPPTADDSALAQALQVTRESLAALQKMQEQTAELHRRFLEGQDAAQRTVQVLVEQQQRLLQASLGWTPAPLATPAPREEPLPIAARRLSDLPPVREQVAAEPVGVVPPAPAPSPPPRVEAVLLNVVSEKTGYPAEMLELDMALDADLGIDSIKRVEILSALQERLPGAPQVGPEQLGALHTLRQVADFLGNSHPVVVPQERGPSLAEPAKVLLEVVSQKTGYPAEMLELDMALDADLGIDSIKRVEILSALQERLPGAPQVGPEQLGSLHTLRQVADFLAAAPVNGTQAPPAATSGGPRRPFEPTPPQAPPQVAPAVERSVLRAVPLDNRASRPPVHLGAGAEVWLSVDDDGLSVAIARRLEASGFTTRNLPCAALAEAECPAELGGLVLIAPCGPLDDAFLVDALRVLRKAGKGLRASGRRGGAVFVTVSRLDGAFGLAGIDRARPPVDGGLAGFCKTAGHEWPEVRCKALDVAGDIPSEQAAAAVIEEMFLAGPVEVGLRAAGRLTLQRVAVPLSEPAGAGPFEPGDVIVISGGARGITAEAAVALSAAFHPTLVLLGRSPMPGPEPDWLAPLSGEPEIKRALALRGNGNGVPKGVGEQYRQIAAGREVRQALTRIEAAGGRVVYRTVDVRDAAVVAEVLAAVRGEFGPIRGLVHGAGVLADARIEDKTAEQFRRVWDTKVVGLRNLLAGLDPDELRALVLFSSSTARFGRAGQADYAAANEVLNKTAQAYARRLHACRVLAVNWGPWDGGMVTSGLKKIFHSEGIGLISPQDGADYLIGELHCGSEVEVVALAPGPTPALAAPVASLPQAFERTVNVADYPVLADHVLDGRQVVPAALILEWLAHAALHHNPGLAFHGCDECRILHGVVLHATPPVLRAAAGKAVKRNGLFVAPVELRGRHGGREILHARAEAVLAAELPPAPPPVALADLAPYPDTPGILYRDKLFHGPLMQAIEEVEGCGAGGIAARVRTAPPPASWMSQPLRQKWLADPLVLDAAFQLLILWSWRQFDAPGLPCAVGRYRQYRRAFPAPEVRIVARVRRAAAHQALADLDVLDLDGRLVARLEGCEWAFDPSLKRAFARRFAVTT